MEMKFIELNTLKLLAKKENKTSEEKAVLEKLKEKYEDFWRT